MRAGEVTVRLGYEEDVREFQKWDKRVESARRQKAIKAELGADFHPREFAAYERHLKEAQQRAQRRNAYKAQLGADFDRRAFAAHEREIRRVQRGQADAVRSTGRLRTAFGSVYGAGGVLFAGAGLLYGLGRGLGYVVQQSSEAQVEDAKLTGVLKSLGSEAAVTHKHVDRLTNSISRQTGEDDELVKSSLTVLSTFKNVRNEVGRGNNIYDRASKSLKGVSLIFGTDMPSAAKQLGKALQDPEKGLNALNRQGITFTDTQREMVARWLEQGKLGKAQRFIMGEVESQVGKVSKEYGKSLPAAMGRAKVALGDVAEDAGKLLAPALGRASEKVTGFARDVQKIWANADLSTGEKFRRTLDRAFGREASARIRDVANTLRNVGRVVLPIASTLGKAALAVAKFTATKAGLVTISTVIGGLVGRLAGLGAAWGVAKIAGFVRGIRNAGSAMAFLSRVIRANPIGILATALGAVVGGLLAFSNRSRRAKVSADQLTDALRDQREATRALRDLDLDAADAKLRVRSANVSVRRAEIDLRRARRDHGKSSLEAKEAEIALREARIEQRRATRGLRDNEQRSKEVRQDHNKATRTAIKTARDRVLGLKEEVDKLKTSKGALQATKEEQEKLRKKERELAGAQKTLNELVGKFPTKTRGIADLKKAMGDFSGITQGSSEAVGLLDQAIGDLKSKTIDVVTRVRIERVGEYRATGGRMDPSYLALARGAKVTAPGSVMYGDVPVVHGEEAPRYPEYWISTNPRDKARMRPLLAEAAGAIGFQRGGSLGATDTRPLLEGIKRIADTVTKHVTRARREESLSRGLVRAEDGSMVPPTYWSRSPGGDSFRDNARQNPSRGSGWRQAEDGSFVPPSFWDKSRGAARNYARELTRTNDITRRFGRESRRAGRDLDDLGKDSNKARKRVHDLTGTGHSARTALRRLAQGGEVAAKELKHLRENSKDDHVRRLAGRVLTLKDRLKHLDKGSSEYRETAKKLQRAQDQLNRELGGGEAAGKKAGRGFADAINWATDLAKKIGGGVKDAVTDFWDSITDTKKIDDAVPDGFRNAGRTAWEAAKDALGLQREINRIRGKTVTITTWHRHITTSEKRARGGTMDASYGRGAKVTAPGMVMYGETPVMHGEEAPAFPEYWISTNPRDRSRMIPLLQEAAQALGAKLKAFRNGGKGEPLRAAKRSTDFPPVGDVASGFPGEGDYMVQNAMRRWDRAQRQFSRLQKFHDLTEEQFLVVDPKTGKEVKNQPAINQRVRELSDQIAFVNQKLISRAAGPLEIVGGGTRRAPNIGVRPKNPNGPRPERGSAFDVINWVDMMRLIAEGRRKIIGYWERLADRRGYPEKKEEFQSKRREMDEWIDGIKETREDVWDQIKDWQLDVDYLVRERAEVMGTKPPPDPTTGPGETPTTPAEIAAAAAAQVAAFQSARSDLFSQFGSNFATSMNMSSPAAVAAGGRYFGGVTPTGDYNAAGKPGITVNGPLIKNEYGSGPSSGHLWSEEQRFHVGTWATGA